MNNKNKITIGVVGIGMVGSQVARYFTEVRGHTRGRDLFLYDADPKKKYNDDVAKAAIIFLCVPTPFGKRGACDTSRVEGVLAGLPEGKVVVIKSTVSPGTTEQLQRKFPQHALLFNPEFLTESRAWEDMIRPDRQVVGYTASSQSHAATVLGMLPNAFYSSPGALGAYTFTRINATEAEMGKYAGNIFGALKVSYANMLADICAATDEKVTYNNVRHMLAYDSRIGDAWLDVEHNLYRGFGGACFPKDVSAFRSYIKTLQIQIPRRAAHRKRFEKLVAFLDALWEYNEELLKSQGLTVEDVSVHDKEWIEKKLQGKNKKTKEI